MEKKVWLCPVLAWSRRAVGGRKEVKDNGNLDTQRQPALVWLVCRVSEQWTVNLKDDQFAVSFCRLKHIHAVVPQNLLTF